MLPLQNKITNKGFTLIELLVVIAVIGVMATVVMVTINPGEQLARGRDAARQQQMRTLGNAFYRYTVNHGGSYPPENANWMTVLKDAGELKMEIVNPSGVDAVSTPPNECFGNQGVNQNGYCYNNYQTDIYIMAPTESKVENAKGNCLDPNPRAWYKLNLTTDTFSFSCRNYPPF